MNQLQKYNANRIRGKIFVATAIILFALMGLAIIIITVVSAGGGDIPVGLLIVAGSFFFGCAAGAVSTLSVGNYTLSSVVEDMDHGEMIAHWAHVTRVVILSGKINRKMFKTLYENSENYFPAVEVDGKQKRDS